MQATADVCDHRKEGEQEGIIPISITDEEAIALLVAYYMLNKGFETKFSPIIMWNVLDGYCAPEIAEAFPDWYIPIIKKNKGVEIGHDDIKNKTIGAIIDFAGFVARVIEVGDKEKWCPFKEPFSSLWHAGFLLSEAKNGYYSDLEKDLTLLANHPAFNIPETMAKNLLK